MNSICRNETLDPDNPVIGDLRSPSGISHDFIVHIRATRAGRRDFWEYFAIKNLVHRVTELVGEIQLGRPGLSAATVTAAIRSASGHIYTGVCVDLRCGIGFGAEHAAVAEMLKHRETQVETIVAVRADGVLPPCGRCRELLVQIDPSNLDARVGMPEGRVVRLRELLLDTGINVS